jgi:hypothetical protein
MKIQSITIKNYKGFVDSGAIPLGLNWTVVVGRNSAGKTALLECVGQRDFADKAHRSPKLPFERTSDQRSHLGFAVTVSGAELEAAFLQHRNQELWIPLPNGANGIEYCKELFAAESMTFKIERTGGTDWSSLQKPSHGRFSEESQHCYRVRSDPHRPEWKAVGLGSNGNDSLPPIAGQVLRGNCYAFRAERRVVGTAQVQEHMNLDPDASNLAGALHFFFNHNSHQFHRYLGLVRRVLPSVEYVDAPPISSNQVRIRVWHTGYEDERPDLAIPLDDCGTGIGQVLAILYAVVTARSGRTIVIDEPNSFLHPSASRALIQVLQEEGRHQYVVSTHSPEILATAHPDKLLLVRWADAQSHVDVFDGAAVDGLQASLSELGVRLSDVLSYDAVVWVEGPTEAKCFPMLAQAGEIAAAANVGFVSLVNTGDVDGPEARLVWDLYRRVVHQSPFIAPPVSISLDAETREESEMAALSQESKGLIRFLPKRSFENYLLHPKAIAATLTSFDSKTVTDQEVQTWMDQHHLDTKYYHRGRTPPEGSDWQATIDASKFLQDLVSHLSDSRCDFRGNKVAFSTSALAWLITNERNFVQALVEYVAELLRNRS